MGRKSKVAEISDVLKAGGHVMRGDDGLTAYHAAVKLRDARRVSCSANRLMKARAAVKNFRVRVEPLVFHTPSDPRIKVSTFDRALEFSF